MNLTDTSTARIERAARSLQRALAAAGAGDVVAIIGSGVGPPIILCELIERHPATGRGIEVAHADAGIYELTAEAELTGAPMVVEPPAEMARAETGVTKQPEDGATEMTCTKCKKPKPIGEFTFRSDRPNRRWTQCDGCRSALQRSRYLSVSRKEAMAEVGIEFIVSDVDEVIGMRCTECDGVFRPGQTVLGDTALRHGHCPKI